MNENYPASLVLDSAYQIKLSPEIAKRIDADVEGALQKVSAKLIRADMEIYGFDGEEC